MSSILKVISIIFIFLQLPCKIEAKGKYAAILIYNSLYPGREVGGLDQLSTSKVDVDRIDEKLSGFFLLDTILHRSEVTQKGVINQLIDCFDILSKRGVSNILIYYSGHGVSFGYDNVLFPNCDSWLGLDFNIKTNIKPLDSNWATNGYLDEIITNELNRNDTTSYFYQFLRLAASIQSSIPLPAVSKIFPGCKVLIISDACRSKVLLSNFDIYKRVILTDPNSTINQWINKKLFKAKYHDERVELKETVKAYLDYVEEKCKEMLKDNFTYIVKRTSDKYKDSSITIAYASEFSQAAISDEFRGRFTKALLETMDLYRTTNCILPFDRKLENDIFNIMGTNKRQNPRIVIPNHFDLKYKTGEFKVSYRIRKDSSYSEIVKRHESFILPLDSCNSFNGLLTLRLDTIMLKKRFKPLIDYTILNNELFTYDYKLVNKDILKDKGKINIRIYPKDISKIDSTNKTDSVKVYIVVAYTRHIENFTEPIFADPIKDTFTYGTPFRLYISELNYATKGKKNFLIESINLMFGDQQCTLELNSTTFSAKDSIKTTNKNVFAHWDKQERAFKIKIMNPYE